MAASRPNVVLLLADDLGYGDLSSYGHPTISTPHLDELARQGVRLTSFYVSAPICTPTRASLLTGRYPPRTGLYRILFPDDVDGLPPEEITLPEALGEQGYRTALLGKWHLGHHDERFYPTAHGFDDFFGLLYSNDMEPPHVATERPLSLYRGSEPIEHPVDQDRLTERYTEEAVSFIERSAEDPFFLLLSYTMPHRPLHVASRFRGQSRRGLYGDVVTAIDWSVGRILETLRREGVEDETLVVFTSDNGPAIGPDDFEGGSAGHLRGAKSTSFEGGFRVPFIARWPGRLPAGVLSQEMATIMDLFPTLLGLAGAPLPSDRTIDGRDIFPLLAQGARSPHEAFFYYRGAVLEGVREGPYKLLVTAPTREFFETMGRVVEATRREGRTFVTDTSVPGVTRELFDLDRDPEERVDLSARHPEIVARLEERMEAFAESVEPGPLSAWPIPGFDVLRQLRSGVD